MQDFIPALLEVQKLDLEMLELAREKAELPKTMGANKQHRDEAAARSAAQTQALNDLLVKKKNVEMDIGQRNEQMQKYQTQLLTLKSNKDYRAMDLEIQALKTKNSELEGGILEIMYLIEEQNKKVAEAKQELAQCEAAFKRDEQALTARASEIDSKIAGLKDQRRAAAEKVDANVLRHYERVMANKKGLCVVAVEHDVCKGCNMTMTRQTFSELKKNSGDIVHCEYCSRILYVE